MSSPSKVSEKTTTNNNHNFNNLRVNAPSLSEIGKKSHGSAFSLLFNRKTHDLLLSKKFIYQESKEDQEKNKARRKKVPDVVLIWSEDKDNGKKGFAILFLFSKMAQVSSLGWQSYMECVPRRVSGSPLDRILNRC